MSADFITVADAGRGASNKRVWRDEDGVVHKEAAEPPVRAVLTTVHAPDQAAMLAVLNEISSATGKFLINGYVPGSKVGDQFHMRTKRNMDSMADGQYAGTPVELRGKKYLARTKDTFAPSSWWQLDRDLAAGQPDELIYDTDEDYLEAVDKIIPGMASAGYIRVASTSGRVVVDGEPLNTSGCRYWFQVEKASAMCDFSDRVKLASVAAGLSFSKLNKNGHGQLWTILDPSVFTPERCIFDGCPAIEGEGLTLADPDITVKAGGRVNASLLATPTPELRTLIEKKHGLKLSDAGGELCWTSTGSFLEWDQLIEVKIDGTKSVMTVREFYESRLDRVRCQATFRDSESWNGALKKRGNGTPYLHDFGSNTLYDIAPIPIDISALTECAEAAPLTFDEIDEPEVGDEIDVNERFNEALAKLKENPVDEQAFAAAAFAADKLPPLARGQAMAALQKETVFNKRELAKAVKDCIGKDPNSLGSLDTHGKLAANYSTRLGDTKGAAGKLWAYDKTTGVWSPSDLNQHYLKVADTYPALDLCKRKGDYKAIAEMAYTQLEDKDFLSGMINGVALQDGYYRVEGKGIKKVAHSPQHNATFRIETVPDESGEPEKLLRMLEEAFAGYDPKGQIRMVRMLIGMTLLGLLPREQMVVFCLGAGNSGKSTLLKILRSMIPPELVAAIEPTDLGDDYKKAALAGKALNAVPEISKDKPIPGSAFKSMTGDDLISAREPYGMPFTFTCTASQWFVGNYFMSTADHSDGFWRRWLLVYFGNSKPMNDRVVGLADQIIKEEYGRIVAWAFDGVMDYLENGVVVSEAHTARLEEWRRDSNTVLSWLHSGPESSVRDYPTATNDQLIHTSKAYTCYTEWCRDNGRRAMGKVAFRGEMVGAGYTVKTHHGYECFGGLVGLYIGFDANAYAKAKSGA
jgi:P4 family phage/plasmid primase-like protien